jgi:hypothetical protein
LIIPSSIPVAQPAVNGSWEDEQQCREPQNSEVEGEGRSQRERGGQEQDWGNAPEDVAPEGAGREGLEDRGDGELGGGVEQQLLHVVARQEGEEGGRDAGGFAVAGALDA